MRESELAAIARDEAWVGSPNDRACPTAEQLAAFVIGGGREDDSIRGHVERCPDCALDLVVAREAAALMPADRRSRAREISGRLLPLAAAALVVLAFGITLRPSATVERETRGVAVSGWVVEPPDRGALSPARRLTWTPAPGQSAPRYRVEVFDARFRRLFASGELAEARLDLGDGLALEVGATYFWRVEPQGEAFGQRSPLFSFRVAP